VNDEGLGFVGWARCLHVCATPCTVCGHHHPHHHHHTCSTGQTIMLAHARRAGKFYCPRMASMNKPAYAAIQVGTAHLCAPRQSHGLLLAQGSKGC
jgi:hypothetical protein